MRPFEAYVEQTQNVSTVAELHSLFEREMAYEGFENHFLGWLGCGAEGQADTAVWAKFPEGHFENYLAENWSRIDPIRDFALKVARPYYWDDVAANLNFTPAQTALLSECKRVGVHSITATPLFQPDGRLNIVGVSSRHAAVRDRAQIKIIQAKCAQTWDRYSELSGSRADSTQRRKPAARLTDNEVEILNWVKDGKSNSDIAEIKHLSRKTVEYHVSNILRKLNATNRVTAVVIAIRQGILTL